MVVKQPSPDLGIGTSADLGIGTVVRLTPSVRGRHARLRGLRRGALHCLVGRQQFARQRPRNIRNLSSLGGSLLKGAEMLRLGASRSQIVRACASSPARVASSVWA